MKARYKFILYLLSLACVWWLFCDVLIELRYFAMTFTSCWWCIHGNRIEFIARLCCWLCAFFWTGVYAIALEEGLATWLVSSILLGLFFQFLASVRSWYSPGCVPMDDDC